MTKMDLAIIILAISSLTACDDDNITVNPPPPPKPDHVAPGAPGETPYWSYAGKQGIGGSYEAYQQGEYPQDDPERITSKVWFSLAQGMVTETMFGFINQAQIRDLQFVISGDDFVATEQEDTYSRVEYLHTDQQGRPLSLAYKVVNTDIRGRFEIEKHIFTDPEQQTLFIRSYFRSFIGPLTAHVQVNPYVNDSGIDDKAQVQNGSLIAWEQDNVVSLTSEQGFKRLGVGFMGRSDGVSQLKAQLLPAADPVQYYQTTGDETGNVALFGELGEFYSEALFDLALSFGDSPETSLAAAKASFERGYHTLLAHYNGQQDFIGWEDYIASLTSLESLYPQTTDQGWLLNASALILKAQEDKTYAGAIVAALSVPYGDTVNAEESYTGYKAVWVRDLYQIAMAFMALGDPQTAKAAFTHMKKVQVSETTPDNNGAGGWFLQKTYVDGTAIWFGVQLDQTAMPLMLAWKLWQAGVLSDEELSYWYENMLKDAADFLVHGGDVDIDWNQNTITPLYTQQDRWEEQSGYSPSTTAAVITGLIVAAEMADFIGDSDAALQYLNAALGYSSVLESEMFTTQGTLPTPYTDGRYFIRIAPDGDPNSSQPLSDSNGRVGLDQTHIIDAGFLELVRYGVRTADDDAILESLPEIDDMSLLENLQVKYLINFPEHETPIPAWRRYGNDGYGEDMALGINYQANGSNSASQRGRIWPLLSGERGHYELAKLLTGSTSITDQEIDQLKSAYVTGMEMFAGESLLLSEQVWDGVGVTPAGYSLGEGTNSGTPLSWAHAEYIKLTRSLTDQQVWEYFPVVEAALAEDGDSNE